MWNDTSDYRPETEPTQFNTMLEGLDKEALQSLRDGLATGDPAVYEYLGMDEDYRPEPELQEQYDPELFHSLTDGLDKETLQALRDGLAVKDPVALDYFGLNSTDEDNGQQEHTKKLTRSMGF